MKKLFSLILALLLTMGLISCSGNYGQIDINETIEIPENGVIKKAVFEKAKKDGSVSVFAGTSGGMRYEWTIFGSDITEPRDIMLSLSLTKENGGIKIEFDGVGVPGFPALLSIHLDEKWDALSATAYSDGAAVYSVSLTGNKSTILNIPITKSIMSCIVLPDATQNEPENTSASTETAQKPIVEELQNENYLSSSKTEDGKLYTDTNTDTSGGQVSQGTSQVLANDGYLSGSVSGTGGYGVTSGGNRVTSSGTSSEKDKYQTDPIPEGKPLPVEPENQEVNKEKTYTCTFSIECSTILNNLSDLDPDKLELVPTNGIILAPTKVTFYEGESVFDVIKRVCKEYNIHLEFSWTPIYNSAYIEGIHNLYEFDCGALSGWMYRVNGWYPNYGCSRYQLADGEVVEWRYTCNDLGKDIGCNWMQ